ncbi:MAG: tRNA (guanosine(46)-N7)-methyltransferase TrmB [Flavobacteriales bacterium]|jgi:tRNA (guanine-N7-)-methyltransferase
MNEISRLYGNFALFMGKDKLKKWAENETFPNVHQPPLHDVIKHGLTYMKGEWREKVFHNENPIVLELGCGKGEYTVGLARRFPEKNFIGIDVKGHRFHKGAKEAIQENLPNVAFLRTRIEFIEAYFGTNEVDEIWLTFSDPQPLDYEGNRRITSPWYLEKYRKFLKRGALLHIKHDNPGVYEKALQELPAAGCTLETHSFDVYGEYYHQQTPEMQDILNIRTFYEQMWMKENRIIKYVRVRT